MRSARWLAAALVASVWVSIGCEQRAPAREIERYTSLARLAEASGRDAGARFEVKTWAIDRDHRVAIAQSAAGALRLGPIAPGRACRLRFGLGARLGGAGARTPPEAAVWLEPEQDGGRAQVFSADARTLRRGARRWLEQELALPDTEEAPFHVVLDVKGRIGRRGHHAVVWGAPHVVCRVDRDGAFAPPPRPHVVLISIDTLRADRLGAYGHSRPTSPVLDAFAKESLVFDRAFATSPWTIPSHGSMLTGLHPDAHGGGHARLLAGLDPDVPTLADALARAGYRTIAFTGGAAMGRAAGFDRGFETWTERRVASLRSVLPEVFDVLGTSPEEPVFLLLHTYDVHAPYDQPSDQRVFRGEAPAAVEGGANLTALAEEPHHAIFELARYRGLDDVLAAYDSGIRYVDGQIGRLLARLDALGLREHALIVVTSDHGESFFENGVYLGHGYMLHDKELHVPLIVRLPGAARRGRTDALVSLVDVPSLILETVGVEPIAPLSGENPLARLDGAGARRDFVRGEGSFLGDRFVRSRRWKVITAPHPPDSPASHMPESFPSRMEVAERVYDLEADPAERTNLAARGDLPADVAELRAALEAHPAPGLGTVAADEAEALREQLEALGYVE